MATKLTRLYSCRDEELPIICDLAAISLERDLVDFTNYSPKFNVGYLAGFKTNTANAMIVAEPKTETLEHMASTTRLYSALDSLLDPISRLSGYLNLAHEKLNISAAEFGIVKLRECIASRDPEGALKNLHIVNSNIAKYRDLLVIQGLTRELIDQLIAASGNIGLGKHEQYAILTNRKGLVQFNVTKSNDLYKQLQEILYTGKILYRKKDPAKLQEYTFSQLKKRVRLTSKAISKKNPDKKKDDDEPAK